MIIISWVCTKLLSSDATFLVQNATSRLAHQTTNEFVEKRLMPNKLKRSPLTLSTRPLLENLGIWVWPAMDMLSRGIFIAKQQTASGNQRQTARRQRQTERTRLVNKRCRHLLTFCLPISDLPCALLSFRVDMVYGGASTSQECARM